LTSENLVHVVDSHTGGEGTRLFLGQVPELVGSNMVERKKYFQTNFDYLRRTLTLEPRYFRGIAAFLVPPSDPKADYGVIFGDFRGYADMCVHGTIGLVTTLFQLGLLKNPINTIVFDTAAGLVQAKANLVDGRIMSVSVNNVPATYLGNIPLEEDGHFREVSAEIAFGGNTFAYVNARDMGLKVAPKNLTKLLKTGNDLLSKIRSAKGIYSKMKTRNKPGSILGVSIYEDLEPGERKKQARNIMIADNGLFDRSPCGTGTCGRMALLHARGKLSVKEEFVNHSIIGSKFIGRIVGLTKVGGVDAIEPEITGTAYLTGIADIIISKNDKFRHGFSI
jgi:proline racemase